MADILQLLVRRAGDRAHLCARRDRLHAAVADLADDQLRAGRVRDAAGVLRADRHEVFGLPFWPALAVGVVVSIVVLGFLFKRLMVDPMLRHGVLPLVIATIGARDLPEGGACKEFYGAEAQPFPPLWPATNVTVFGARPSRCRAWSCSRSASSRSPPCSFSSTRTRTGRCMQATAQNPTVARLLGIPVERMILYTFLINAALVALASILITPIYLAKFTNGELLGLYAFIAAIIGGFNQVRGAIAGGLLLGVVDNFAAAYRLAAVPRGDAAADPDRVILFRPQGLLGRAEERTV